GWEFPERLHQFVLNVLACDRAMTDFERTQPPRADLEGTNSPNPERPGNRAPLFHRLQRYVELHVEEAGDVGTVIRAPDLRHDPADFGDLRHDLAQPWRHPGRFLKRDGPRHEGADPEIAFFQRRHELSTEAGDQAQRED